MNILQKHIAMTYNTGVKLFYIERNCKLNIISLEKPISLQIMLPKNIE